MVDELLEAWRRDGKEPEHKIKILGHLWSAASYEIRDFLARNMVPYRWYNVSDPEGEQLLTAAGAGGEPAPVVITRDGEPLVASLLEVANAVGLTTTPQGEFYDVVIIGGGPAGLGAAVYAASEGLKTVIVTSGSWRSGRAEPVDRQLPGFPDGVTGDQLAERARLQAQHFRAELPTARTVVGLETRGPARQVMLDDGSSVLTHAVVLATGVSYRHLEANGAPSWSDAGSITACQQPRRSPAPRIT